MGKALLLGVVLVLGCTRPLLTDRELAKLDPPLQKLMGGGSISENQFDVSSRPGGEKEYGVIIRSSNPEELRSSGIPINSVIGDVITARLTVDELRKVLTIPSVHALQNSSKNYPQ
jgi:hypothetical protein